jgi:NAD-dependent SIR2 family protein deacetylase
LAELQARGRISGLITQNVDGLHDQAGSTEVVELHGNLHRVVCLDCGQRLARGDVQALMVAQNPYLAGVDATQAPDGDTLLDPQFEARFKVPTCPHCQGDRLKPDVVFFGENVVAATAERAMGLANEAPGLLVVGSSLMAYSAFRLCRAVAERGRPVVAINLGKTRGDDLLSFKLQLPCDQCLPRVAKALQ